MIDCVKVTYRRFRLYFGIVFRDSIGPITAYQVVKTVIPYNEGKK